MKRPQHIDIKMHATNRQLKIKESKPTMLTKTKLRFLDFYYVFFVVVACGLESRMIDRTPICPYKCESFTGTHYFVFVLTFLVLPSFLLNRFFFLAYSI